MKQFAVLALGVALAACQPPSHPAQEATKVPAPSYDGANYATDAEKIAHGERLTWLIDCRSCHSLDLTGEVFPHESREPTGIHSANLTRIMDRLSDADFETIMRKGTRPDGTPLYYMPTRSQHNLSAADMAALIAYLRSLKPEGEEFENQPTAFFQMLISGPDPIVHPAPELLREAVDHRTLPHLGVELEQGRYIASISCGDCHGPDLMGDDGFGFDTYTPGLGVIAAYDDAQLYALLKDGTPAPGRKVGLMGSVGRILYTHMTDNERKQVIAYLRAWLAHETNQDGVSVSQDSGH